MAAVKEMDAVYKDSRDLIVASNNYLGALVDFESTNKKIQTFSSHHHRVTIVRDL